MIEAAEVSIYLCIALCLIAAVWDVRTRRIPNLLCAGIAATAIGASYLMGGFALLGSSALHALLALLGGMALFATGFIGAGDAKMYSSAAFAVPLGGALQMLGWTSVAGLGLLIVMAATRRLSGKPLREGGKSFTVPYAVPITIGFTVTALM